MIMMIRALSEKEEENNSNNNNSNDRFHLRHCHYELWLMKFYDNNDKDIKREGRGKQQQ